MKKRESESPAQSHTANQSTSFSVPKEKVVFIQRSRTLNTGSLLEQELNFIPICTKFVLNYGGENSLTTHIALIPGAKAFVKKNMGIKSFHCARKKLFFIPKPQYHNFHSFSVW